MMIIDGDFIPYTYGFIAEKYDMHDDQILNTIHNLMTKLSNICNSNKYIGYVAKNRNNYRNNLLAEYKQNRKGFVKPSKHKFIKNTLIQQYGFNEVDNVESDDAVSITANLIGKENALIVSTDKDMLQVKGHHFTMKRNGEYDYNYVEDSGKIELIKGKIFATGFYLVFAQMLKGDSCDNYSGLRGWGDVKTYRLLKDVKPQDLPKTILKEYKKVYKDDALNQFNIMFNMAYLCRNNDSFVLPSFKTL
jgi:5'-3' exonuclease